MIIETKRVGSWAVSTQGLRMDGADEMMRFDIGPIHWGNIDGGIAMDIGTGYWVVSFADFEAMYNLAKAARENDVEKDALVLETVGDLQD